MFPTYIEGENVLVQKGWFFCRYKSEDIVVCRDPRNKRMLLKRIKKIRNKGNILHKNSIYFVVGDNTKESTDSREFGWLDKNLLVGKVMYPKG